jgi:hypothetical protein
MIEPGRDFQGNLVDLEGLEPPTPWFEAKCSIQLSYRSSFRYASIRSCGSRAVGRVRKFEIFAQYVNPTESACERLAHVAGFASWMAVKQPFELWQTIGRMPAA